MGTGLPGWSSAVGSCLAIQATILLTGSLLGLGQRFEAKGGGHATGQQLGAQGASSLSSHKPTGELGPFGVQREMESRTTAALEPLSITIR